MYCKLDTKENATDERQEICYNTPMSDLKTKPTSQSVKEFLNKVEPEGSKQEGDWPLTGFSPRKQNLTLYIMAGNKDNQELLDRLGKHKTGGGCLYIKRLSDVDQTVIGKLIEKSFHHMEKTKE